MQYICIDIGGTSIKYGILHDDLTFAYTASRPTQAHLGGAGIMEKVFAIITECQQKCTPSGICISTAGMVDWKTGSIQYANALIPNYTGTPIKSLVESQFNLPCEVENDVNCAGLAEARYGAAKGQSTCVCMTIGTGIGGCILSDGKIFRGAGTAGAIGYLPLAEGNFEHLAAASVLTKRVAQQKNLSHITGETVFTLAQQGDSICQAEIARLVHWLAVGISSISYLIAPDMIVLGGGIMAQKAYLSPLLEQELSQLLLPNIKQQTQIAFAAYKNHAGLVGALCHFLQQQENA